MKLERYTLRKFNTIHHKIIDQMRYNWHYDINSAYQDAAVHNRWESIYFEDNIYWIVEEI